MPSRSCPSPRSSRSHSPGAPKLSGAKHLRLLLVPSEWSLGMLATSRKHSRSRHFGIKCTFKRPRQRLFIRGTSFAALAGRGLRLFLAAWVIVRTDIVELHRRHSVDLHHDFSAG